MSEDEIIEYAYSVIKANNETNNNPVWFAGANQAMKELIQRVTGDSFKEIEKKIEVKG